MAGWILPYPRLCLFDRLSHFCKPRNSRHRRISPTECHWARLKKYRRKKRHHRKGLSCSTFSSPVSVVETDETREALPAGDILVRRKGSLFPFSVMREGAGVQATSSSH